MYYEKKNNSHDVIDYVYNIRYNPIQYPPPPEEQDPHPEERYAGRQWASPKGQESDRIPFAMRNRPTVLSNNCPNQFPKQGWKQLEGKRMNQMQIITNVL